MDLISLLGATTSELRTRQRNSNESMNRWSRLGGGAGILEPILPGAGNHFCRLVSILACSALTTARVNATKASASLAMQSPANRSASAKCSFASLARSRGSRSIARKEARPGRISRARVHVHPAHLGLFRTHTGRRANHRRMLGKERLLGKLWLVALATPKSITLGTADALWRVRCIGDASGSSKIRSVF